MDTGKKFYYKIHKVYIRCMILVLILSACAPGNAQTIRPNKYGLTVIDQKTQYQQSVKADSNMKMVDLQELIPTLVLDLKYRSRDNFMRQQLYAADIQTTYLRAPAAIALKNVQEELAKQGLGLKIWDAYRPYSVTVKMWEVVKDDRYAADPKFGSGHNRGVAVDLTLIDLATGLEKDMGTGFDNFSDTAHAGYSSLPADVLINRKLLIDLMQKNGFKVLDTEWWHFYLPDNKKYFLMDLSFKTLKTLSREKR
jgi:D-alanyl-D-alanine dipeptidase